MRVEWIWLKRNSEPTLTEAHTHTNTQRERGSIHFPGHGSASGSAPGIQAFPCALFLVPSAPAYEQHGGPRPVFCPALSLPLCCCHMPTSLPLRCRPPRIVGKTTLGALSPSGMPKRDTRTHTQRQGLFSLARWHSRLPSNARHQERESECESLKDSAEDPAGVKNFIVIHFFKISPCWENH